MTEELHAISVDDEYLNLVLIEEMGKKLGLRITSYTDPKEALEYLKHNPIDMAFVDYMMPQIDGLHLIKETRSYYPDIPIVMITAVSSDNELKLKALESGATDFLSKPLNLPEFSARVQNLKQLRKSQLLYKDWASVLQAEVHKATEEIAQREHETLKVLGSAAEFKDPETGEHILREAHYSRIIAEMLTDDRNLQQEIFHAVPLHDIGKIGIPDTILLKPSSLTDSEFKIMKEHTTMGHDIMRNASSNYLKRGASIALSHHEKWDGSGYPQGLAKDEIPLCGQVLAVADVFDALTSKRPYKEAWSVDKAVEHMRKEREKHFAPAAIDAFLSRIEEIKEIHETYSE